MYKWSVYTFFKYLSMLRFKFVPHRRKDTNSKHLHCALVTHIVYRRVAGAPIFTYTHEPDDNEIHNGCKTALLRYVTTITYN